MNSGIDSLRALPVDGQQLTPEENTTFNNIYQHDKPGENTGNNNANAKPESRLTNELMDTGIAGVLFIVFALPTADKLVEKMLGEGKSSFVKTIVKAVAFMILFYIIKNLSYMKKKKE